MRIPRVPRLVLFRIGPVMGHHEVIADRRRTVLQQVFARRQELASALVDEYRTVIAEYRELPESVLIRDVAEAAVQNIEYLVEAFESGFDVPDDDDIEWIRRSAARRVHQHISLPSLLRTYRLWGTHIWRTIARYAGDDEVGTQVALEAADAMLRYLDSVSSNLTRAYIRESSALAADSQSLRTDVLETLLTGEPVNERARRQTAVLSMTLRMRLLVVVLQVPTRDDPLTGVQAALRAVRNQLAPVSRTFLVGARDTEIVSICTLDLDDAAPVEAAAHQIAASGRGWTVGIGRITEGVTGVRRSYAEAHEAAELGFSTHQPGRAIRFADVLLDQILRSTRHTDALLEETVRPLAEYDQRKNAELLPTLRAYVRANFNLTKAAAELTINPNTVVYRLRRIHALTRRDPSAVDDLLLLALGLRLFDSVPPV